MADEPEKKANSPNDDEIELEIPEDEIEFISDFIDFDAGSSNDPSFEKTEELRVLKNGKPYTADELDVFGERMFSMFRPTGQDIEDWIEHGYTDLLSKRVYPNYEKYINNRKKDGEDVQEDEEKLDYMKKQSKYNLRKKLNNPWDMSDEEKRHFNGRTNSTLKFLNQKDTTKPLDDKELNELVNGVYAAKLKAGKIHADFKNMNEKQRGAFEEEYKSQIKIYFRNLQENGMAKIVRTSHNVFTTDNMLTNMLQAKIIKNWKKDASEMNLTDDICNSLAIPTTRKGIVEDEDIENDEKLDDINENEQNSDEVKNDDAKKEEIVDKEEAEDKKTDLDTKEKLNKDHPDTQTLTKVDETLSQDELLNFADKAIENPEKELATIQNQKQSQSKYQPGEKVIITKDNGEQQEDTVSKVEQHDLGSSPTVHTETGQTLKEEDSKMKEKEPISDQEVKHQENYLSDREYVQRIEEQTQMAIVANKIRTASNTIANAFRKFEDYDESKNPLENMKNLIEFVGYDTTGVLKQSSSGVNYMSVRIDDGTVFDYSISKDISTKDKFKQSLYDTNKRSNELAKQTDKNADKEIKRLSRERYEASEYRRKQSDQTKKQSQNQSSGISMN